MYTRTHALGWTLALWAMGCSEGPVAPTDVLRSDARQGSDGASAGDVRSETDAAVVTDASAMPDVPDVPDVEADAGCTLGELTVAAAGVTVVAPFDTVYRAFDLGRVPGLPMTRYGGCLIDRNDPNRMYIGVDSELATGAIYAVRVVRGCGRHIVGYAGMAERVASAPYVDANLFYDRDGNILYSMWPNNQVGVLAPGGTMPAQVIDLSPLGIPHNASPGGLAFVPVGFVGAGELRASGWSDYGWFRIPYRYAAGRYTFETAQRRAMFTAGTGGIAYVPVGSPMIARPSIVMAEWSANVAFFEADANGDARPETRRAFLQGLSNAWGAYFEPVTGDFMFPSWGNDRVVIVQGFNAPPPPPPPPPIPG